MDFIHTASYGDAVGACESKADVDIDTLLDHIPEKDFEELGLLLASSDTASSFDLATSDPATSMDCPSPNSCSSSRYSAGSESALGVDFVTQDNAAMMGFQETAMNSEDRMRTNLMSRVFFPPPADFLPHISDQAPIQPNYGSSWFQPAPSDSNFASQAVTALVTNDFGIPPAPFCAIKPETKSIQRCASRGLKTSYFKKSISQTSLCPICDEPTTGMHFGIECCSGCMSFFRRSIRNGRNFKCKLGNKCNARMKTSYCRACRLRKCLAVGMNKNAVQSRRDRLIRRRVNPGADPNVQKQPSSYLVDFSTSFLSDMNICLSRTPATLEDMADYLNNLTPTVLKWAKDIPGFSNFTESDQAALVFNHRVSHLLLGIAAQSLTSGSDLLMGDRHFIEKSTSAPTLHLGQVIWDSIVEPLEEIQLDEFELTTMTSVLLFDVTLPWVADKILLEDKQTESFVALEEHVRSKLCKDEDRFERIWVLIDALRTTAFEASGLLRKAGLLKHLFM